MSRCAGDQQLEVGALGKARQHRVVVGRHSIAEFHRQFQPIRDIIRLVKLQQKLVDPKIWAMSGRIGRSKALARVSVHVSNKANFGEWPKTTPNADVTICAA